MSCQNNCGSNPCATSETNTAACESVSSQINNFTLAAFGEVVKTEIDGQVVWSLPCDLETGLPNNPRGLGEGLLCYYKRLFLEGIIGLQGPIGETGAAGTNGDNAFTVLLASFTQPTLGSPNVQIATLFNPAMLVNLYVFIENSGWYQITATDGTGNLWLTLVKAISNPPTTVTAGKLIVPSGFPGQSIVGPTGPQGATGPQGSPGVAHTQTNGQFTDLVGGTDYNLQIAYAAVDFTNLSARVLLPTQGTYLVTATVGLLGLAGVVATDIVSLRFRNSETALTQDGSEHDVRAPQNAEPESVHISVLLTSTDANQQITLQGKCTTVDKVAVVANRTTMTYVKVA